MQKLKDANLYKPIGNEFYHIQQKKKKSKFMPLRTMKSLLNLKTNDNKTDILAPKSMGISVIRKTMSTM